MNNLFIGWDRSATTGTLSVQGPVDGADPQILLSGAVGERFVDSGPTIDLAWDTGAIDGGRARFAFVVGGLAVGDRIQVEASNIASRGQDVHQTLYDTTAADAAAGMAVVDLGQEFSGQYWNLRFNQPAGGPVSIGRMGLYAGYVPQYDYAYGFQETWIDENDTRRSIGGHRFDEQLSRRRQWSMELQAISKDERLAAFDDFARATRLGDEVLIVKNLKAWAITHDVMFGTIAERLEAVELTYRMFESGLTVEEVL